MGKKSGSNGGGESSGAKEFVLKVATHCHCDGCTDKIRGAVKELTRLEGIQSWDQSALESKGELRLLATADPEKLRHRLHKATRKNVDLLFPKPATDKQDNRSNDNKHATAKEAALLLKALQQQQQQQQLGQFAGAAWANQLLAGGGGGGYVGYAAAQAYPWAAQQPDPYAAYSGVYPAAGGAWGAYAYPPAAQQGYGGPWHGHGY